MKKTIILFLTIALFLPVVIFASVGVGVNLGKIEIDEPLKPGASYNFPSIGVLNTGDTAGEYELAVTYHQDQPQLRPEQEWFSFSPSLFNLEAGASQNVTIKLTVPMRVKPGDYFAYLEAHPIMNAEGGGTTIGVAAATKAYFTIAPANIWQAIYYKTASFLTMYAPWTYVVLLIILGAVIIAILKKFFAFQINVRKKT